jgi:hypothetical protein
MKHLLASVAVVALLALTPANADTIITFGQDSGANTITGTGGLGGTTITGGDIAVTVTQIASADPTPISAFLDFSAANTTGATVTGGIVVTQHFSGTFSINAAADNSGTNYLSGAFTDGAIAVLGGTQIVMAASTALFASDTITTLDLPRAIGFSLTNVDPAVSVTACPACDTGQTIASFTASVAGNAAANAAAVPEPASLLLLGGSLLWMAGAWGWRRRFSFK